MFTNITPYIIPKYNTAGKKCGENCKASIFWQDIWQKL